MSLNDNNQYRPASGVGERVNKVDADEKVTGETVYGSDLSPPDGLVAAVVRSDLPHATIDSVETASAEALPGVCAVVERTDLLGDFDSRVRSYGDVIAAVAAESEAAARSGAELIEYELSSLESVTDPREALTADAPVIHENNADFGQHGRHEFTIESDHYHNNVDDYHRLIVGDVQAGFDEADFVYENEYVTPRVSACNLDTHCCIAEWEDDVLVLTETIAAPSRSRDEIAAMLGLESEKVQVRLPPTLSSNFGARSLGQLSLEPVVATLARETGRPVKLWFDRTEEFVSSDHRHRTYYTLKMGITAEGKITALSSRLIADTGSYPNGVGHIVLVNGENRPLETYDIPNYDYEGVSVYTNNLVGGEFRGIGSTQLAFALDSHVDELARRAGIDPIELRMQNFVTEGDHRRHTGRPIESCGVRECIERGRETFESVRLDEAESDGTARGWGVGCGTHTTGLGAVERDSTTVSISLSADETLTASVDVLDHGQGTDTVMAQIVSEELAAPMSAVSVERFPGTDSHDDYLGSVASRSTYITGMAVKNAAEALIDELRQRGADALDADISDITVEYATVSDGTKTIFWFDLFSVTEDEILVTGSFESALNPPAYGAHFAQVEVDLETGGVDVLAYVAAQDVGFAINPPMVEGQLEGAIAQGIEFSLLSDITLQEGIPSATNFREYPIISPAEIPTRIECELIESREETGPYGAKAVGTPSMPPVSPAIFNAIRDATGQRFTEAPLDREAVILGEDENRH